MRLPSPLPNPAPALAAASSQTMASLLAGVLVLGSTVVAPPPAVAKTDGAAIGKCLLKKCQLPLARCVTDPTCAPNLLCIQTCTAAADEADCQIRCGDAFANDVVADFTKCAVTDKNCVPQRQDDGSYPVPKDETLVTEFSTEFFEGPWYISAGLNTAFDTFDCQLHKFEVPAEGKLVGNLQWRIKDPVAGTNFVTRYTVQEFVQDKTRPGILYNHDNDFLHYQDDWYVLAAKPNEYALIYYRGSNDAWDGYGGAVVYTRDSKFPKKYTKEIDAALQKVGLSFKDFTLTDNSCKAAETKVEELKADLVFVESKAAAGLTSVEKGALNELTKDVKLLESEAEMIAGAVGQEVVREVVRLETEVVKDVVGLEKEVVKDVVGLEKEVVKDVVGLEKQVVKDEKALESFISGLLTKR